MDYLYVENIGGIGLKTPKDDLLTLFCKWFLTILEQSGPNIKTLFKFKNIWHSHSWNKKWSLNLNKALTKGHAFTRGSKVWGQVMRTWKNPWLEISHLGLYGLKEMTQVSMGLDGIIIKVMWDELLDYGRMEWQHMLQLIEEN